jgi:hypothetical protein
MFRVEIRANPYESGKDQTVVATRGTLDGAVCTAALLAEQEFEKVSTSPCRPQVNEGDVFAVNGPQIRAAVDELRFAGLYFRMRSKTAEGVDYGRRLVNLSDSLKKQIGA